MTKKTARLSNGIEIAYLERPGGTQPLVLLHGITDSSLSYEPLLDKLDANCHIYALDLRGHGDSSKPEDLYDTGSYAADVALFIKEVVGQPVLLAGHSLGGLVTVKTATTAPDLVTRIFLEDPPLYFVDDLDPIYQALFEGMVIIASTLQDLSRSIDEWFNVMASAPDPYSGKPGIETMGEEKIYERLDVIGKMKPKALQDGLDGSLKWDTDTVLKQITCPVTMMTGNSDLGAVISIEESARVQQIIPDCQVINVADVGHLIHDLDPDGWVSSVNQWISEQ